MQRTEMGYHCAIKFAGIKTGNWTMCRLEIGYQPVQTIFGSKCWRMIETARGVGLGKLGGREGIDMAAPQCTAKRRAHCAESAPTNVVYVCTVQSVRRATHMGTVLIKCRAKC